MLWLQQTAAAAAAAFAGNFSLSHILQATSVQQNDIHVGDVDGHEWEVEWFDEDAEKASKVGTLTDSKEVGCANSQYAGLAENYSGTL